MFGRNYNSDQGLEAALAIKDGRNSDLPKNARCDLIKILLKKPQVGKNVLLVETFLF